MGICDTCAQLVPTEELSQVDLHFECMVCRGQKSQNADQARYFNAADLAEDYGVFEPLDEGYRYVKGAGWTRG